MLWSAQNNSFFLPTEGALVQASDAIPVVDDVFNEFGLGVPPAGKTRIVGNDSLPAWGDLPAPTPEDVTAMAEQQKAALRAAADAEISWRQDAVDAGIATAEEAAALIEWKKYRVLLMRVDTVKPVWPTPPGEKAS